MAVAYFLARAGVPAHLYEGYPFGVVLFLHSLIVTLARHHRRVGILQSLRSATSEHQLGRTPA